MTVYPREYTALSADQAATKPLVQGPWPMDRYPCSLDYINYHVNGVEGMR
ncbi:BZ3500_MvSof-1268-A1-R1_Chr5-2g08078 [Microbotryum saponariae]|uniref:BZ3500_MvSof-1268-A1-R1_Chr2-2g04896 protein n=1 Tax=Microbotryum saponariae TaxID=289078 RepID=A0A2X0LZX0_9BASI|nr:BZ3500_MvSof-1268-A1-R1_Chr2-2g04896 [Microbotryum saponariae]SCZ92542.1 BZ3500_MvSof-1268-A1-R1_Chr5-2g07960 [Microbotryum saponariae]SCZ92660.1 BZ3500_MvSof-1268-A1-R1_Chr5-2g08078 [Microbotryum saponariae]SDA00429.1 BZ3501_MvSof-1269-A2-R1_Chr2-2g04570 [Microbotryum saponariae]SDA05829.1 BZ3501_MvSof-1269-A2-R1_Chr5-2g07782 [Microbotryum saponariae]